MCKVKKYETYVACKKCRSAIKYIVKQFGHVAIYEQYFDFFCQERVFNF